MCKIATPVELMEMTINELMKCSGFPKVGALIAKDGKVLSTGFRGEINGLHAERVAINKLNQDELSDLTLYTTLEPCILVQPGQKKESCTDLIIKSGIKKVVIGVLDTNGTIYSQGYSTLVNHNISVSFFKPKFRDIIEQKTLQHGEIHKLIGPGKKKIPVIFSGTKLEVQFSKDDQRKISFRWGTLQSNKLSVDLYSTDGSVKIASGINEFSQVTDHSIFRFPSHYARMRKGMIAIVNPPGVTFYLLVKLLEIYQNDILFSWEMRNII